MKEWKQLLKARDVNDVLDIILDNGEHADDMKQVSPLLFTLTQYERMWAIAAARH